MNETLAREWLFSTQLYGMKLGLENMQRLCEALGHPERRLEFVHVAGTNGKGSTCAFIEAVARANGLRTGMFTSPHLVDVRERFQLDRRPVCGEEFAFHTARVRAAVAAWEPHPTFFELCTAIALLTFAAHDVDVAVWETGMGGRLDATNVVMPKCAVLTPIDLDHKRWLGDTPAAVAAEKAGILKPGVPAVSARQLPEVEAVLTGRAAQLGALLQIVGPLEGIDVGVPLDLLRRMNAGVAMAACEVAGISKDRVAGVKAITATTWPGRWHEIGGFLVDGAHNPHAMNALADEWRRRYPGAAVPVVFGAVKDKDIDGVLCALVGIVSEFHFVRVSSSRTAEPEELVRTAARILPGVPTRCHRGIAAAMEAARSGTLPGAAAPPLIAGSLFLAGEALRELGWSPDGP